MPDTKQPKEPNESNERKDPGEPQQNVPPMGGMPWMRSWSGWLLPLLLFVALWAYVSAGAQGVGNPTLDYSAFYTAVEAAQVSEVSLRGDEVTGRFTAPRQIAGKSTETFRTRLPAQGDISLLPLLRAQGVAIAVDDTEASPVWNLVVATLPWLLIIGGWFWLSRRAGKMMTGGSAGLPGMLKQKDRRVEAVDVDVSFADVAGLDAAKRDLREIVEFLKEPERFGRLGGKLPRGVLLMGAPGTGKTLLARAVAGEAGVPFFSMSGSEFIELFVGVGASRVRELFAKAKEASPAIIFIDEIDAVGRSRGTGLGGGHDEREQTLNQLLAEMDGFVRNDRIVVLAATNRPDVLDPALLRPGRFDRRVVVDLPESRARLAILKVHTLDKPLDPDVVLEDIAAATPGFSGADLANLANEAALGAMRRNAELIAARDFTAAQDKVMLGDPRDTHLSPDEKQRVAVHESGHALVAQLIGSSQPLHRVSIIPRGMSLGATQQLPQGDQHLLTRSQLDAKLRVLLGGYAAEDLVLGEVSSGSENDLRQASELAMKMVAHFGMSEALGPVFYEHQREHPFLGARIATDSGVSDATVHQIESEARTLLEEALAEASTTIKRHRQLFDQLVNALLSEETLEKDALRALFAAGPASGTRADESAAE